MKTIEEKAFAKINLSLDVLHKREDGYHDMLMLMQSIDLCDELTITLDEGKAGISVTTDKSYLPSDEGNLAYKAASAFLQKADIGDVHIHIDIKKHTPVCAGMAGGSSDGAAVIRGLNALTGADLSTDTLLEISRAVGSDVAFCLLGGTMMASGKGDELERVTDLPMCDILVCKPDFPISTPKLFSKLDSCKITQRPDTDGIISALNCGCLEDISRRLFNVFESVLSVREKSTIDEIKGQMLSFGALGASMTGTGSAVYGIFESGKGAAAYEVLKREYDECFLTAPTKKVL